MTDIWLETGVLYPLTPVFLKKSLPVLFLGHIWPFLSPKKGHSKIIAPQTAPCQQCELVRRRLGCGRGEGERGKEWVMFSY